MLCKRKGCLEILVMSKLYQPLNIIKSRPNPERCKREKRHRIRGIQNNDTSRIGDQTTNTKTPIQVIHPKEKNRKPPHKQHHSTQSVCSNQPHRLRCLKPNPKVTFNIAPLALPNRDIRIDAKTVAFHVIQGDGVFVVFETGEREDDANVLVSFSNGAGR